MEKNSGEDGGGCRQKVKVGGGRSRRRQSVDSEVKVERAVAGRAAAGKSRHLFKNTFQALRHISNEPSRSRRKQF